MTMMMTMVMIEHLSSSQNVCMSGCLCHIFVITVLYNNSTRLVMFAMKDKFNYVLSPKWPCLLWAICSDLERWPLMK